MPPQDPKPPLPRPQTWQRRPLDEGPEGVPRPLPLLLNALQVPCDQKPPWGHQGWVGDIRVEFRTPWLGWGHQGWVGDAMIGLRFPQLSWGRHGWVGDIVVGLGTSWLGWGHQGWVGDAMVGLGTSELG